MKEFKTQHEMFIWIWDNRDHKSEISNKQLLPCGHPMWHWQFAHILPKGTYKKWKLNPDNIMLMLPDEHEKQESFEIFIEKHEEMRKKYTDEFYSNGVLKP